MVGVHQSMPAILWMRYFLDVQEYLLRPTKVHQDNLSIKHLETNGRASSSKRTRHMNDRYLFVAEVQKRQHITIEYCPTDEIIGNFFTKPLGRAKFRRFRDAGTLDNGYLRSVPLPRIRRTQSRDPMARAA